MIKDFVIYGCEGFAREVLPLVKRLPNFNSAVFVDDNTKWHNKIINGIPCISFDELCSDKHRHRKIIVAIADSFIRNKIVEKCRKEGFEFYSLFSKNFIEQDEIEIGEGAIFCDYTTILSNAKIGKHFHCNIYSYVAHDCEIGDYVTFSPRVCCNGRVHVHDFAYIGTGVTIKQGIQEKPLIIGEGAIIGMGAVITKDVEPYTVMVGNPAKILRYTR